jgi:hypothetical protein
MSTVLASQSLAAAATVTSGAYPYDPAGIVLVTITNGGTQPNVQPYVQLQLSSDNSNWTTVDLRLAGAVPSQSYFFAFPLANYAYALSSYFAGYTGLIGLNAAPVLPLYYRLVFTGNDSQAVTIAATTASSGYRIAIPITPVTSATQAAIWTAPQGGNVIVNNAKIIVTTASTGAATLNCGIAANATTSSATLIAATSVHTSNIVIDSTTTTSGVAQIMTNGQYITSTSSATLAGLVAELVLDLIFP